MRQSLVILAAMAAGALAAPAGQALAQEICFSAVANQQFHLAITGSTATSAGSVLAVAGINHMSGDPDLRSPVTGTIYIEPDTGRFRVSLQDPNGLGLGTNLTWNARLGEVPVDAAAVFSGPFTVDTSPGGARLTGTMTLVDCDTGDPVPF